MLSVGNRCEISEALYSVCMWGCDWGSVRKLIFIHKRDSLKWSPYGTPQWANLANLLQQTLYVLPPFPAKVPFYRTDQQFPKRGASWFCRKLHTVRPWWGNRFLSVSVWRGKHHLVSVWSMKWPHGTIPGAWPLSAWQPVSKAGLSLTLWVIYKSPTSQQAMTFLGSISLYWERVFSERHISFWGMQWVRVVTANFIHPVRFKPASFVVPYVWWVKKGGKEITYCFLLLLSSFPAQGSFINCCTDISFS